MYIEGLDELESQFDALEDVAKKGVMRKSLNAGIAPIKKEAKRLAPVDTGQMKTAIRSKALKKTKYPAVGLYVQSKGYYWYFLEHGTSTIAPMPFIRPASDSKHEEGVNKFKEKMKIEIDKITH